MFIIWGLYCCLLQGKIKNCSYSMAVYISHTYYRRIANGEMNSSCVVCSLSYVKSSRFAYFLTWHDTDRTLYHCLEKYVKTMHWSHRNRSFAVDKNKFLFVCLFSKYFWKYCFWKYLCALKLDSYRCQVYHRINDQKE